MQTIFNDINNIFKSITNKIYNETNIRNRKISIEDILLYRFKYSQINKTKQNIVSEINFNNKKVIDITTFYRKEQVKNTILTHQHQEYHASYDTVPCKYPYQNDDQNKMYNGKKKYTCKKYQHTCHIG